MKVRLQSINRAPASASSLATAAASAVPHVSLSSLVAQTFKFEGVRGFYKGVTPNVPGLAIYNVSVSHCRDVSDVM